VNLELTGEPELVDGSKIERLVGVTSGSQESELEVEQSFAQIKLESELKGDSEFGGEPGGGSGFRNASVTQ
jgi:hypothetical protein